MDAQSMKAENNPSLLVNRQWLLETTGTLVRIADQVDAIRNLDAPTSVQSIHETALEVATTLEVYLAYYISYLENTNIESMLRAEIELTNVWGIGAYILLNIDSFCDASE